MRFIVRQIILSLVAFSCFAQQGSNWIFPNAFELDFYDQGPSLSIPVFRQTNYSLFPLTTIADASGKLLIYTDSQDIRDKNGNVLKNGTGLNGVYSIIIPRPGYDSMYYVFTLQYTQTSTLGVIGDRIAYAIADLTANSGA